MNRYSMNVREILYISARVACFSMTRFAISTEFWSETRFETFEIRELISGKEDALAITSQFRIIRNFWHLSKYLSRKTGSRLGTPINYKLLLKNYAPVYRINLDATTRE